jgi:hypothetical protein
VRSRSSLLVAVAALSLALALAVSCNDHAPHAPVVDHTAGEGEGSAAGEGEGATGEGEGAASGEGEGGAAGEGEGAVAGEGEGAVAGEGEGATSTGEGEGEGAVDYGPYDVDGSTAVNVVDFPVTTDRGHHFTVHAFIPNSSGAHPVVLLASGLEQPAVAYTTHGTRLASHGIITLTRDDSGLTVDTPIIIADLTYTMSVWLPQQNADSTSALFGLVDMTRLGLAGHSRGGKATLLAAEHELHGQVLSWFGIDAVDNIALGGGEFARTDVASVGVPVVFLGSDGVSSCTPANTTADMLYPLAASPAVKIIGIHAGHTEFEDQAGCSVCSFCSPAGTADPNVVLRYSVRYLAAFFGRTLLGDQSVGPALEGTGIEADVAAGLVTLDSK